VFTDVLVKFTYYGDANLDGKVDGTDYSRIDSGYLTKATGWYNGDLNYDGVVDGSDYTLMDNAFNTQGASLASLIAIQTAAVAPSSKHMAFPTVYWSENENDKKRFSKRDCIAADLFG
jgi:hypothetical protein